VFGKNNSFGHPTTLVLERLESIGCKIFRTDIFGEISIEVKSNGVVLKSNKKSIDKIGINMYNNLRALRFDVAKWSPNHRGNSNSSMFEP
jgi:hypothetical protein